MAVIQTGNGLEHIGIPTQQYDDSLDFYKTLGFMLEYTTQHPDSKGRVGFLLLGNLRIEIWEEAETQPIPGAIHHFAIEVNDIRDCYARAQQEKLQILPEGIQYRPFWQSGIEYFMIQGPNAEQIEFCQKL